MKRRKRRKRKRKRRERVHPTDRQSFLRCFWEMDEVSGVFQYLGEGG